MIDEHLMVQAVVEAERCGRWVTAALGLARLHERHEADDDRTDDWDTYAARSIPLPPERLRELLGKMLHGRRCLRCGSYPHAKALTAQAVPPKVTAVDRASAAIAASPDASNRAVAKAIGVSEHTVRLARRLARDTRENLAEDER